MTTYTYTTLNDLSPTATDAEGINGSGQIVGGYYYNGSYLGFLYSGGSYTIIDYPLAVTSSAQGINDAGQIVGNYVDSNSITHGYLYNNGTYSVVDDPLGVSTNVEGINNAGQIVGYYVDSNSTIHGFMYSGGSYITIDDPLGYATFVEGINDLGQVVGYYFENNGTLNSPIHGFLYSGGTYTTIDDPVHPTDDTILKGINDAGQVVGYSYDSNASGLPIHSFLLKSGSYTTIDDPLGTTTVVQGINDAGQVVGFYYNADNISHSFIAAASPPPAMLNALPNKAGSLLSGTAEANSSVSVFDGKKLIGTVTASSDGTWNLQTKLTGNVVHSFTETAIYQEGIVNSDGVTLYTPSAHELLMGGNGDDVLIGQPNDTLTGGSGADRFVFNQGFGKESVTDFVLGQDTIALSHTMFTDPTQVLSHTHDSALGAVIVVDSADQITLAGISKAQLQAHPSDFTFF